MLSFWDLVCRAGCEMLSITQSVAGEKVVPLKQEGTVTSCGAVAGAVMFGRGREQCGILIEPQPDFAIHPADLCGRDQYINIIWYASLILQAISILNVSLGQLSRRRTTEHRSTLGFLRR